MSAGRDRDVRFEVRCQQSIMRYLIRTLGWQALDERQTPEYRARALIDMREMMDDLAELVHIEGWMGYETVWVEHGLWPHTFAGDDEAPRRYRGASLSGEGSGGNRA